MSGQTPEIWFPHLGIQIEKLSRVAVEIASFKLYWYGVFIVLGVLLGMLAALQEAKRVGHDPGLYTDFLLYALIAALAGARLYYVIFSWDNYKNNLLQIFAIREGGLAIYGGVIGSFICAYVYTKKKKLNFWAFGDVAILGLILGQAVGRWGNFFNREVFGHYTDSLLAMRYLKDQVSNIPPSVLEHVITVNGAQYIQVQPAFLYESLWNLLVFTAMQIYKKHKKMDGEVVFLYLFGYGLGRFFIEGIRTDQLMLFSTGIPVSQLLSALLVLVSAVIFAARRRAKNKIPRAR
ncbi:MAG: prolipoprotein diacylglyceryl transferase [Clostridiales bacterium]|jgi:phosphatidylglycerol:prolipoprotein diacylglycerol transferase|nr:prolipoprotein diacylglyceryl transferase [Clostridiales bacterium]